MSEGTGPNGQAKDSERHSGYTTAVRVALISLLMCGVLFPLVITGVAQAVMPYQANGELVSAGGRVVGSHLIAQPFTSPMFFHPRNDSASRVDPDITLQDAYSQIPRIHNATGIPVQQLVKLVNRSVAPDSWISGQAYVNVLGLNLELIESYPSVYAGFP